MRWDGSSGHPVHLIVDAGYSLVRCKGQDLVGLSINTQWRGEPFNDMLRSKGQTPSCRLRAARRARA